MKNFIYEKIKWMELIVIDHQNSRLKVCQN